MYSKSILTQIAKQSDVCLHWTLTYPRFTIKIAYGHEKARRQNITLLWYIKIRLTRFQNHQWKSSTRFVSFLGLFPKLRMLGNNCIKMIKQRKGTSVGYKRSGNERSLRNKRRKGTSVEPCKAVIQYTSTRCTVLKRILLSKRVKGCRRKLRGKISAPEQKFKRDRMR